MNNFRGFASRLKDAASKIPNFDDMAAKDDYIHTEEFNVRGQKKPKAKRSDGEEREGRYDQFVEAPTNRNHDALDSRKTSSNKNTSNVNHRNNTPPNIELASRNPKQDDHSSNLLSDHQMSTTSTPKHHQQSTNHRQYSNNVSTPSSYLAVVANTLKEEDHTKKNSYRSSNSDVDGDDGDSDLSDVSSVGEGRSLDNLSEDEEEDDPILSMIRKSSSQSKKKQRKQNQKQNKDSVKSHGIPASDSNDANHKMSSRRFFDSMPTDDDDETLEAGTFFQGMNKNEQQSTQDTATSPPPGRWNWMKSMATERIGQVLGRQNNDVNAPSKSKTASKGFAPLARIRGEPAKKQKAEEEEFHIAESSAMLADDELAQLAKFKQDGGVCSLGFLSIAQAIVENRYFGFLLLTLVLYGVVYYYLHLADNGVNR
jgi:hypothetical protein